jgi:hypothetical protein
MGKDIINDRLNSIKNQDHVQTDILGGILTSWGIFIFIILLDLLNQKFFLRIFFIEFIYFQKINKIRAFFTNE